MLNTKNILCTPTLSASTHSPLQISGHETRIVNYFWLTEPNAPMQWRTVCFELPLGNCRFLAWKVPLGVWSNTQLPTCLFAQTPQDKTLILGFGHFWSQMRPWLLYWNVWSEDSRCVWLFFWKRLPKEQCGQVKWCWNNKTCRCCINHTEAEKRTAQRSLKTDTCAWGVSSEEHTPWQVETEGRVSSTSSPLYGVPKIPQNPKRSLSSRNRRKNLLSILAGERLGTNIILNDIRNVRVKRRRRCVRSSTRPNLSIELSGRPGATFK